MSTHVVDLLFSDKFGVTKIKDLDTSSEIWKFGEAGVYYHRLLGQLIVFFKEFTENYTIKKTLINRSVDKVFSTKER